MYLHDEISRIADMDDIGRIDLQGVALADFPVVTREMAFAGVETAFSQESGSRLPSEVDRSFQSIVSVQSEDGKTKQVRVSAKNLAELSKQISAAAGRKGTVLKYTTWNTNFSDASLTGF